MENELENFYGFVGMGLIVLALPYLFQEFKRLSEWEGRRMEAMTVFITYIVVGLYHLSTFLARAPEPTAADIIILILGLILYPLLVWAGTQGLYTKTMSPSRKID